MRSVSSTWMTAPSVATPRSTIKLKKAEQLQPHRSLQMLDRLVHGLASSAASCQSSASQLMQTWTRMRATMIGWAYAALVRANLRISPRHRPGHVRTIESFPRLQRRGPARRQQARSRARHGDFRAFATVGLLCSRITLSVLLQLS